MLGRLGNSSNSKYGFLFGPRNTSLWILLLLLVIITNLKEFDKVHFLINSKQTGVTK